MSELYIGSRILIDGDVVEIVDLDWVESRGAWLVKVHVVERTSPLRALTCERDMTDRTR